jgi:Fe-S cluster assembly protein SufD
MSLTQPRAELTAALIAAFPEPSGEAGWAAEARRKAESRLVHSGLPLRRDEYWRFTDPSALTAPLPIEARDFRHDRRPVFAAAGAAVIVFTDGRLDPALSDPPETGVDWQALPEALRDANHWAKSVFGILEAAGQSPVPRPLALVNTARARHGVVLSAAGRPARPLALDYRHADPCSDTLVRHVLRLEPGAEFTLIEHGPGAARFNSCLEVEIGAGATFHHIRVQGRDRDRRMATHVFARLAEGARLRSFTLSLNGALTRNETVVEFAGENASAHVAGAAAGDGAFHHDDTVFITHGAAHCESRQVFKKVLKNGATGVFQGKILVRPGAQKTDGYQLSQGLLLDEASTFLAKPELEIYADDVACSHGSTVGGVDRTALYYLTSRGIPRAEAEAMLILAFLDQALAEIADARLADAARDTLRGWMARHG